MDTKNLDKQSPIDLFKMPDPDPTSEENAGAAPEPKKFTGLARDVKNEDELLAYAKDLEKTAVESTLAASRTQQQGLISPSDLTKPATKGEISDEELGDLMYTDPKAYQAKLEERIEQRMDAKQAKKKAASEYWDGFYKNHPDLRNASHVVQSILRDKPEIGHLPVKEGERVLAEEVRSVVAKIRGEAGETRELSRTSGGTLPTTGAPAPVRKTEAKKPQNFMEQVKEMQAKRRRA